MAISMSKKQLAEIVGVPYNTLRNIDEKWPDEEKLFQKSEDGKYDLAFFVQRWIAYKSSAAGEAWTRKRLSALVGYTERRLRDIEKINDISLFVEETDGGCSLSEFVRAWTDYRVSEARSDDITLDAVKAEHELVKKRKTEFEVRKMEGELVEATEVERYWTDIAHSIMQGMLNLPNTLAPMVQGLSSVEVIRSVLDNEIRKTLTELSKPAVPNGTTAEHESEG